MYQCPNCGGGLRFDIASQKLVCDHCQTQMAPYDFKESGGAEEETEFEVTKFICPQCGAEIVSSDNTAAAFCSFCGASTILDSRISQEKRPDGIIPFQLTKDDCVKAYTKLMKHSIFAPKELKDEKCIDGFRGIYMPYWVYHVVQQGSLKLKGSKSHREGDYDITRYFSLTGELDASYDGITHDASTEFADDISESAAPYDVKKMQPFHPSYLSGFYADTEDVNPALYQREAVELATDLSTSTIEKCPEYRSYNPTIPPRNGVNALPTRLEPTQYAMFPVWFMSYRKKDRVSYVTINGQTGKIAADIPIDEKRYGIGSLLLAIPIFLLLNILFTMTASKALFMTSILTIITAIMAMVESHTMKKKEQGAYDKGKKGYRKRKKTEKAASSSLDTLSPTACIICFVVSILMWIMAPVSDYWYYGCILVCIAVVFLTFVRIIRNYNILASRKLPQFDRTGGDDRA